MNFARTFFERNKITTSDLARTLPPARADNWTARWLRARRLFLGDQQWTPATIEAALKCCREKLERDVTYEEVFVGRKQPRSFRKAG